MFEGHDRAIRNILAARGEVDLGLLEAAWTEHVATGRALAEILLAEGTLTMSRLFRAVADHVGAEYRHELPSVLPGEAIAAVSAKLARAYGVAPLAIDGADVVVAAVDPLAPGLVEELAFALGRSVRLRVAEPALVQRLIDRHYGSAEDAVAAGSSVQSSDGLHDSADVLSKEEIEQLAGQGPVVRFVNGVLARAVRDRASDVHFEPFDREFRIRYRVDGALCEIPPPPVPLALPVISRLKVLANLNIAERRVPQDGRMKLTVDGRPVDLRISTLPTQFGESVVLRVLDRSSVRLAIPDLGLPPAIQSGVEQIVRRPNGIFAVTGPTGAGKTTTLYACLQALNSTDAKLVTVEDPVEYEIDGVMQVPVNIPAGLTFARALRTFLRQDPDVVMVGEIRDSETAQIAIQASLTGHLVLTTLHTNDAPSAVARLSDLGIEPFLLASTLEAVLAQRLLRRLCPSCRVAREPAAALCRELGVDAGLLAGRPFFQARGCPDCGHTGYKGRLGIYEFLPINEVLRESIVARVSLDTLRRQALEQGLVSLRRAGVGAILASETTVEEVLKYT